MKRLLILIITTLCAATVLCSCNGDDANGQNSQDSQANADTSSEIKESVSLDWWNDYASFKEFTAYSGAGTVKQEKPELMEDVSGYTYTLADVPKTDYLNYVQALKDSGLELYDYNFGFTPFAQIEQAAMDGYAIFEKDCFMLELTYTESDSSLLFSMYAKQDGGE